MIVELDPGSPPAGRVIASDGSATRFAGWTELAAALEPQQPYGGEALDGQDVDGPAGRTPGE